MSDETIENNITIIASDLVRQNTLEYAKSILSNHFPSPIDGMKRVRRRIIYKQKPDEVFSGSELVSRTLSIHPYGDTSIYDTACRMIDSFRNTFPLLFIIGTGGSYGGDTAASARYVKFKLTDFCKEIFISDINAKTLPMDQTENFMDYEIRYFIPKIPTALIMSNESVGFGYSSHTIPLKFENICDLVIDYANCADKINWNYRRLAKLFVPCFPIHVYMKNEAELIDAYSKGDFSKPIITEGEYRLTSSTTVLIRTLAYGIIPLSIRSNIEKCLCNKDHWLAKMEVDFKPLSSDMNHADFSFNIKRGANIFEFIDMIKGILRLRTPTYVVNNFVLDDKLIRLDPPEIIRLWYNERYRSIFGAKSHRQRELHLQRMKLETYLIICEHLDEVVQIIRTQEREAIYITFRDRFELSLKQCDILLNTNLQILMKSKHAELTESMRKVDEELIELNLGFQNIDKEIATDVKRLKKKFKTDTTFTSREVHYIGSLIIGNLGIMQVKDITEVMDTAKLFHGVDIRFLPYHSEVKCIKFLKQSRNDQYTIQELPMTINSSGVSVQYKTKSHVFVRMHGKSQCVTDTYFVSATKAVINHVSDKPFVILSNGSISKAPVELFDTRKHTSNVLYAFDLIDGVESYTVISVNIAHPSVIRLQNVIPGKTKVIFSGAGETSVIAVVVNTVDSVIVSLPEFHRYSIINITDILKNTLKGKLNDVNIRLMLKL